MTHSGRLDPIPVTSLTYIIIYIYYIYIYPNHPATSAARCGRQSLWPWCGVSLCWRWRWRWRCPTPSGMKHGLKIWWFFMPFHAMKIYNHPEVDRFNDFHTFQFSWEFFDMSIFYLPQDDSIVPLFFFLFLSLSLYSYTYAVCMLWGYDMIIYDVMWTQWSQNHSKPIVFHRFWQGTSMSSNYFEDLWSEQKGPGVLTHWCPSFPLPHLRPRMWTAWN